MGSAKRAVLVSWLVACPIPFVALHAQQEGEESETNVPEYVSDLIVHVEAFKPRRREDGAGIVVGMDDDWVYIATARHVVTLTSNPSLMADSVRVEFESARMFVGASIDTLAAPIDSVSEALDIAVLRVPMAAALGAGFRPVLDRVGDNGALRQGSEVRPVGCPGSNCWRAPTPPDRVLSVNAVNILFQTGFVRGGSSGGGIFNQWDEVVGMVYRVEPPGAYAFPMDFVLSTIESWGRPVSIQVPDIPRGGYPTSVGFTVMAPTSGKAFPEGRAPSGRLTITSGLRGQLKLNVSLLRIAPGNVRGKDCPPQANANDPLARVIALRDRRPCEAVVNAVMAGLGARIQYGRWVASPFAEVGFGRSSGRYDVGGVYQFDDLEYLPNFKAVEQNRMGGGAGLTLDYVLLPRTILQGVLGYWRFQDAFEGVELPAGYKATMPSLYVGFGLRWGL